MAYGLVQDTTLQGMADALRSKGMAPETREKTIYVYGQHINTPTHPDDEVDVIPAFEAFTTKVTPVPEATKFIIRISKLRTTLGSTAFLGYLNIYENGNIVPCDYVYADTYKNILVSTAGVENVEVQLKSPGGGFSATIEVLAVDADGNYIEGGDMPYPITVTNTLTPDGMVDAINNASAPPPDEAYHITGFASNMFNGGHWDWFVEQHGDKITTSQLRSCTSMFANSKLTTIPFELNIDKEYIGLNYMFDSCENLVSVPDITVQPNTYFDMNNLFNGCKSLENPPYIYNAYPSALASFMSNCWRMRDLPVDYTDTWNFSRVQSYTYASTASMFQNCYSLRRFPAEFLKKGLGIHTSGYNMIYNNMVGNCYALDEAVNIPVHTKTTLTSNVFSGTFSGTLRLKNATFELDPETNAPYVVQWKSQTLDFTTTGYSNNGTVSRCCDYNSGITKDKEVKNDATYQALKNDPDWCTAIADYSRYNHDSAVATINSLPDTSAYLASAGGTNTIKFKGACGEKTDGGAINTLTEEEIAVATAKGWTVTM